LVDVAKRHRRKVDLIKHCPGNPSRGAMSPWGPFLTTPLATRGEICSLGRMITPSFTPRGEHSRLFRRMEGQTENFTPRTKLTPGGQLRP
jgi:hypothetical protein